MLTQLNSFFASTQILSLWVLFFALAILIIIVAYFLPRVVLELFKHTRVGLVTIGLVFISFFTSLPEVLSTIFAGLLYQHNLEVGYSFSFANIIGANLFSATALIAFDFIYFRYYYLTAVPFRNKLTLAFVVGVNLWFLLLLLFPAQLEWKIGAVSIPALLMLTFYFTYLGFLFWWQRRETRLQTPSNALRTPVPQPEKYFAFHLNPFVVFAIFLVLILTLLSSFFVFSSLGRHLRQYHNLSANSLGGLLFAITTAFPELLGCFSLFNLRLGNVAIAVIFGSHLFNLLVFIVSNLYFLQPAFTLLAKSDSNLRLLVVTLISTTLFWMHLLFQDVKPRLTYFIIPLAIIMLYLIAWAKII